MKVLLLNGSPNEKRCTYTTFSEVTGTLGEEGTEAEVMHVKKNCIMGRTEYGACSGDGNRCIFDGRIVNKVLGKTEMTNGLIVGSPVYSALPTGAILSPLDRTSVAGNKFYSKPAAAVTSARGAETMATIDVLNKYFNLAGMLTVSSNYHNVIYGHTPRETRQDKEGMQIMCILGKNIARMSKCTEAGREKGLVMPRKKPKIKTSCIR